MISQREALRLKKRVAALESMIAKPVLAWAGIVDGKLDLPNPATMAFDGYMQIYPTRKQGKRFYEKVARVKVTEIK